MLRLLQRLTASDGAMRAVGLVAGPFHPWHPDVRRDPYPTWRRLRESWSAAPRAARWTSCATSPARCRPP